jgi:hypothetical protein
MRSDRADGGASADPPQAGRRRGVLALMRAHPVLTDRVLTAVLTTVTLPGLWLAPSGPAVQIAIVVIPLIAILVRIRAEEAELATALGIRSWRGTGSLWRNCGSPGGRGGHTHRVSDHAVL